MGCAKMVMNNWKGEGERERERERETSNRTFVLEMQGASENKRESENRFCAGVWKRSLYPEAPWACTRGLFRQFKSFARTRS